MPAWTQLSGVQRVSYIDASRLLGLRPAHTGDCEVGISDVPEPGSCRRVNHRPPLFERAQGKRLGQDKLTWGARLPARLNVLLRSRRQMNVGHAQ